MYRSPGNLGPRPTLYRVEHYSPLAQQWQALRSRSAPVVERFHDLAAALQYAQDTASAEQIQTRVINALTGDIMHTFPAPPRRE